MSSVSRTSHLTLTPFLVGCFFSRNLGGILSSLPTLGRLSQFLVGQSGAASTPAACKVTVTVKGMLDQSNCRPCRSRARMSRLVVSRQMDR
jgi:hypothetical protein